MVDDPDSEREPEASPSTRSKIVETGESLFAKFGFAGVGMRAVADSVGVSKSALFHHFPTKRALWAAVLESSMLDFEARIVAAADRGTSALDALRLSLEAVIDALAENPSRAPLLLRSLFEVEDEEPADAAAQARAPPRAGQGRRRASRRASPAARSAPSRSRTRCRP